MVVQRQQASKHTCTCAQYIHTRVQGFIRGGGELEFPPQEILKLSMGIIVSSQVLNSNLAPDCVRSNLRGSKFKIFLGVCPQIPLVGTYTYACVNMLSHATIILLPFCFSPPNSKSYMHYWCGAQSNYKIMFGEIVNSLVLMIYI